MTGRAGPARVRELAEQGLGRNACSRELSVSRRQIDTWAREAGVSWVRTSTEAATKARVADVRASLTADFADIADGAAERLLDALDRDELDPRVLQALAQVAGAATDKLTALADRLDADDHHGDSLLDQLRGGFDSWAAALADQDQHDQITTTPLEGTHE